MYLNTIEQDIQNALSLINLNNKFSISQSDFENFDYQTSLLFQFSKKENFSEIKSFIINHMMNTGNYEEVSITGKNYLSIKINPTAVKNYTPNNQHIIVDYCGVNVAKQMHIGHIRSMFIGDYIAKSHEYIGDKVTRFNHIGDWGNQFGFLLLYILQNNLNVENNKQLTDYYKKSYQLYQDDKEFALQATNAVSSLQKKEEPIFSLWKKCCDISIDEMNKTTKTFKLSISPNDIQGESFYASMLPSIEKILLDNQAAIIQDDGTLVSNFKNLPTLLLKKSSGSYLYAMYDVAAIYWRINQLNPDKIIYVVDKRQELHFKQIFEIAHMMGWDNHCQLVHIAFGFILDKNNKPLKTKSGKSLYLDELIEDGFNEIKNYPYYDKLEGEYKKTVIENTLYGALKFFDLHSNSKTDYQFDWDNILNAKGGTAPYVQNAYVRIDSMLYKQSILNQNDETKILQEFNTSLLSKEGVQLYKQSIKCVEAIYTTLANYSCHLLEEELLKLCKNFHSFYEHESVSNIPNQLGLIISVKKSIEQVCNVFGIDLYLSQGHFNQIESKLNHGLKMKN